jgi:hypothetical protein
MGVEAYLDRVRGVPTQLDERRSPVSIDEIDVVVIDVHGVPVEGEVNPTSIDLLGAGPGLGLLLGYTHQHHTFVRRELLAIGLDQLVFVLTLGELDPGNVARGAGIAPGLARARQLRLLS